MKRLQVLLVVALTGCAQVQRADPEVVIIQHGAMADDLVATTSGRCGTRTASVAVRVQAEEVSVRYGNRERSYGPAEPFARDLLNVQHTAFRTIRCMPDGGFEFIVTSPDLRNAEAYFYTVTLIGPDASVRDYSGRWDPLESTCRHASLSIL